jgi:hypothetical protein
MTIIALQRRLREAGRIRIGETVATSNGKTRPAKLDKFRFTSADKASMDAIAAVYGGKVDIWDGASVGIQYELYTETTVLDVIVPPVELAFSQFMELWKGGGCERRCDGQTNLLTDKPCACDPDAPDCKPTTRLGVILTAIQGIGVFRLETHGWNAAQELNGAIEILSVVQNGGRMIPARLMLEQRQSKRDGKTYNFAVPVLDLNLSVAALTGGHTVPEITSGVTPIDATRQVLPSVAEQVAAASAPVEKPKRANAAATLPSSGITPPSRGAEAASVDEIQIDTKPTKAAPATHTEGGASIRSMKRLMALLNGNPAIPKGDDDARHVWARDALGWDKDAPISFAKLTQEEITLLNKVAEGRPADNEPQYAQGEEPF